MLRFFAFIWKLAFRAAALLCLVIDLSPSRLLQAHAAVFQNLGCIAGREQRG